MSSTIQNKPFFPVDNWVVRRELSLPLTPEKPPNNTDDNVEYPTVSWLEKVLFKMYTGLDLQKVRISKIFHSPRFKQLGARGIEQNRINADLTLRNGVMHNLIDTYCDLEFYWVDRELSVHIKDIKSLQQIFDKKSVMNQCLRTGARDYNESAEQAHVAYQQLTLNHPIESALCFQVWLRLYPMLLHKNSHISYDENSDTFQLEPSEEGEPQKSNQIDTWITKSLGNRLEKDIERRKEDPDCRLLFVYNEIYEEKLKQRIQLVNRCWLATTLVVSLVGVVFFCRVANRIKCD